MNLLDLQPGVSNWTNEQLEAFLGTAVNVTQQDRKETQILFYKPVSPRSMRFHESKAKVLAAGGGNRSSKTTSMLVEMVICATGIFPYSLEHLVSQKFRGPINMRLVVESLTTTLEPVILPKLMYWRWNGVDKPGGERGHWGWIPKMCLIDGEWDRSWSAKLRMLRLLCRDPENHDRILGESTWQFMSFDQDPTDFASGEFHIIGHDEPPKHPQWQENEARVMSVGGRLLLAMTWPDDPAINVDWLYNDVYEPARTGATEDIEWLELHTTDNRQIDQAAVAAQAAKWSPEMNRVRLLGQPIRFSNRIHPQFTDQTQHWCFKCEKSIFPGPLEHKPGSTGCVECGSEDIQDFCHVEEFDASRSWPTVFVLDPHPRKPHDFLWVQLSPQDDWYVVADGNCADDCVETRKEVERTEILLGLAVKQRWMDPNMGASPSGQRRNVTWQDEFRDAGLYCELADDSDVGRGRINTMFKVDPQSRRPRLVIHPRCKDTIYQLLRFSWSDYAKNIDRAQKQTPSDKYSDKPACLRYFANSDPVFRFLKDGAPIIGNPRKKRK